MTTKPRVLIFSTAYYPLVGGAEVAVKQLTDRLLDYDFDLITAQLDLALPAKEQLGRVTVYRVGCGWPWFDKLWLATIGAWLLSWRLHRRHHYSLVWAIMASYGGLAALNFKIWHRRIPFLLTLQEGDDLKQIAKRVAWWRFWWRKIFTRADAIQAISTYLADWAKNQGATAPITVIPNGVDLQLFRISDNPYRLKRPEKIIVSASRLVSKNGLDTLISSLSFLPTTVKLRLYGVGPEEDNLKQLVDQLSLSARVNFAGYLPAEQLAVELADADIFVRPSRSEGLGNSFLEAMALGLPTVGTAVGGIVDFLHQPGVVDVSQATGWLVPVDDSRALAKTIEFIIDPDHRQVVDQVRANGQSLVRVNYDWDLLVLKLAGLFAKLVEIRGS